MFRLFFLLRLALQGNRRARSTAAACVRASRALTKLQIQPRASACAKGRSAGSPHSGSRGLPSLSNFIRAALSIGWGLCVGVARPRPPLLRSARCTFFPWCNSHLSTAPHTEVAHYVRSQLGVQGLAPVSVLSVITRSHLTCSLSRGRTLYCTRVRFACLPFADGLSARALPGSDAARCARRRFAKGLPRRTHGFEAMGAGKAISSCLWGHRAGQLCVPARGTFVVRIP